MKHLFVVLFIALSIGTSYAQEEKSPLLKNIFFGGNVGATFGTITNVNLSPLVGYRFLNQQMAAGLGVTYQYYKNKNSDYQTSVWGGRIFAQATPNLISMLLLHAELEGMNYKNQLGQRNWYINPLVGGGIRLNVGQRSHMYTMVLLNLGEQAPYQQNPIIRVGYAF